MMASNKELYNRLGVDETASDAEIKSAYERLISLTPKTDPKYAGIEEAYVILSDLESRAAYDVTGKKPRKGSSRHRTSSGGTEKARYALNTLFLAGSVVTIVFFILQWSGAVSTTPFYWACGISLLIKISEYILRLVP